MRSALLVEEPLLTLAGLLLLRLLAVRNIGVGFVGVLSAGFVFLRSRPSIANFVAEELLPPLASGRLNGMTCDALFRANRGRQALALRLGKTRYSFLLWGSRLGLAGRPSCQDCNRRQQCQRVTRAREVAAAMAPLQISRGLTAAFACECAIDTFSCGLCTGQAGFCVANKCLIPDLSQQMQVEAAWSD